MARTITFQHTDEVLHTISERVGGTEVGGNAIDVMLIQYLLNRRDQSIPYYKPYGAQRPLALDGVMGAQTHYRLLHFIVRNYGVDAVNPPPHKVATLILPIPNPTLEIGLTPQVVILAFPMALLSAQAYARGFKPTTSQVSLPDMPPVLAEALEKNVTDFSSTFPKSVRSKV